MGARSGLSDKDNTVRLSLTLSGYIGRQFLLNFVALLAVILLIAVLFDIIELLRRAGNDPNVTMGNIIEMATLKLPFMGQQVFPFAALFGGMMTFWRLARYQELVITRASGISAWQFLLPVIGLALLLGVFQTTLMNPISSASLLRYERIEAYLFKGKQSLLAVSSGGIWLRQANADGQAVIHAKRLVSGDDSEVALLDVIVFQYGAPDVFDERIDADRAVLEDGFWRLENAVHRRPEEPATQADVTWLETDLTLDSIQDSFAPPETMSFWSLPEFIETLEESGFSARRHRLYLHALLSNPLLMCAMVLIAATFTLRHSRRGGVTYVIGGGILTGFLLYFFTDLIFALGRSESIPVTLAAWTPSGVATLLGLTALLHLEDG